jgi:hypothetical protein
MDNLSNGTEASRRAHPLAVCAVLATITTARSSPVRLVKSGGSSRQVEDLVRSNRPPAMVPQCNTNGAREFKERNGRYSARLVVPMNLRPLVGKAELETQLGGDRRQALAKLPGAVAALQATIATAERKAVAGQSTRMRVR